MTGPWYVAHLNLDNPGIETCAEDLKAMAVDAKADEIKVLGFTEALFGKTVKPWLVMARFDEPNAFFQYGRACAQYLKEHKHAFTTKAPMVEVNVMITAKR